MNALTNRLCAALASLVVAATTLISCGGVGQDGTGAAPPDTYTSGVVNGFGSVIVNGTHFDVRRADIVVDGTRGRPQSDLRVGMVVEVSGTVSADGLSGTATRVVYESLLRGRIESLSSTLGTLQVLGQQVTIDDTTLFSGAQSVADLTVGDLLQVSGLREPNGGLRATRVAREAGTELRQLTQVVTAVAGNTVQLAGLNIDITGAELVGVTAGGLAAGQLVRVDLQAPPAAGAAVATRLRLLDTPDPALLRKQQRQGFVAQWDVATNRFVLNGQRVQVDAQTLYQDGAVTNLFNGARVEVTGVLDNGGILRAAKLRFLRSTLSAYGRGRVTAVDAANLRFNLLDQPGVEVRVRAGTLLNDNTGGTLNLGNLLVGDEIVALGLANGTRIEAEVVTRLATNPIGSGVAGPAQSITSSGFTLLGVPVTTNGLTDFLDAQGNPMTAAAFFAALQQDGLVRAEGLYAGGVLTARTVRRVN